MKRVLKKVAILGSGIMGSRIACHFANIGLEVLLLDIVPRDASSPQGSSAPGEISAAVNRAVRNKLVNASLLAAVKSNPSPLYSKKFVSRISAGNFEDDMKDIAGCDWVIEVVVEDLTIKKQVYDQVEKYRRPQTLITSNTSGIPIHLMAEGRSEDFKKHFCGTHFFNPPRYLRLLEIIPAPDTASEVIEFLIHFGERQLGKTTVLCKDTPAFIANRIGVYSIMSLLHLVDKMNLSVEEVDTYTGPALGRPKSATFRTNDVVGLDTMIHVANGVYAACPNDEAREVFVLPAYVDKMAQNKWLGDKTGQGFYKKVKNAKGESEILALNLKTLEYEAASKFKSATLDAVKSAPGLAAGLKVFEQGTDKAGEFFRASFYPLFAYCSHRIPEISNDIYRIDDAMRAGFGWEMGPFEVWDALGVKGTVDAMQAAGHQPAKWILEFLETGNGSFYKVESAVRQCYDPQDKIFKELPGSRSLTILDNLREQKTVKKTGSWSIIDLGDGILDFEVHTKMNTLGADVIRGLNQAIDLAEKDFRGLVIGNDGANFSAGANVAEIFMAAVEEEWDEINLAIRSFQNTSMRLRYSSIPVIVAPHQLCLGGSCEIAMHADWVQLHAETYMGLVELGVGLIPGGGGTKEFALRASDEFVEGEIDQVILRERFLTIGMAKVSTSAYEAFTLGYLQKGKFGITMNAAHLLADAKVKAIELSEQGYTAPVPRKDIRVLGKQGLGIVNVGANSMRAGQYISDYDKVLSERLGWVLCGGDLSNPAEVNEQYLLDLEREVFLSLCREKKTLERIQSIISGGKPLRN